MSKYKIVILDENPNFVNMVKEAYLEDEEFVVVAGVSDGIEGVRKIEAYKPDVVLLDLILPTLDGFGVLDSIDRSEFASMPKFIVLSQLSSENVISRAIAHGADFFIKKPAKIEIIKQRIREAVIKEDNPEIKTLDDKVMLQTIKKSKRVLDEKINNIFLALGIPAHIKGFQYLKDGIKLVIEDADIINFITKKLYPEIAIKNNTQAARVERAIRHAIEVSWNKGKFENLNKIFGMKLYTRLDKPTNGELIALIANKLITEGA